MSVTLTFDNGPTEVTAAVLDVLSARGVRATFFAIGQKADTPAGRRLLARAVAEGHRVGNHTRTHATPLGRLPAAASVAEIADAQAVLDPFTDADRLFRPYGVEGQIGPHLLSPAAVDHLRAERHTLALWTSVPGDWRDPEGWVEPALADVDRQRWPVVALHDIPGACLGRLPEFLDGLDRCGAETVQTFPPDVTPIVRGETVGDVGPFVSPEV